MSQVEIRLPKMGESVTEATITNWLKKVGDTVEMDEPLVEVATDKVDNELPSEVAGTVVKIFFQEDEVAQVGDVIALVSTDGDVATPVEEAATASTPTPTETVTQTVTDAVAAVNNGANIEKTGPSGKFYSPLVRSIASAEGISIGELENIIGTGKDGRVTKKDMLDHVSSRGNVQASSAPQATQSAPVQQAAAPVAEKVAPKASIPLMEGDEIIEMDRMRKLIADHMVQSVQTSPHVTSFVEADVTDIWNWRNKVKDEFKKREGENFTFTPIFIQAVVKAIKDFPGINISLDGNKIIKRKHINIGMAAALPSGNLIVPVIKDADQLNLTGLAKQVNNLAKKAREGKLTSDDISGGTYTLTNVGTFGNVLGTPIINQPQVAIMATGAIRKMPAVIETPDGDFIGIRYKMFLSHSYDHRIVDGALGGMFVKRVAEYLEAFDPNTQL